MANRFLFEDTINWGNHKDYGGGRSVMLSSMRIIFLLGFRKVYLLGCDLNMREDYTYHFDEQRSKGAVNGNLGTYKRLKDDYFPQLKPFFDAEGFQVFNCNKESELKCFPFISFEDAIKDASNRLPDPEKERSWGMYSKPEEKPQWKNEPDISQKRHLLTNQNLIQSIGIKDAQITNSTVTPNANAYLPNEQITTTMQNDQNDQNETGLHDDDESDITPTAEANNKED